MTTTIPDELAQRITDVAVEAARTAGEILCRNAGRALTVDAAIGHDVRLEVDRLCEKAILDTIRTAFPEHAILAEESGAIEAPGEYTWVVDPLDGTVNYYYGLPYYCTSIACYAAPDESAVARGALAAFGRPVTGVVYTPPTDELFIGRAGRGATRNGEPIHVSNVTDLREAIFCTGFGKSDALVEHAADVLAGLAGRVRKLRCLGAAAYDMANVACGRLSAFYERSLRTWDIAAGAIILAEAGGVVDVSPLGLTCWEMLASAPGIHGELKATLPR